MLSSGERYAKAPIFMNRHSLLICDIVGERRDPQAGEGEQVVGEVDGLGRGW